MYICFEIGGAEISRLLGNATFSLKQDPPQSSQSPHETIEKYVNNMRAQW